MDGINTVHVPDSMEIFYGGSYTYACRSGYRPSPIMTTYCLVDSTWSLQPPPNCSGKYLDMFLKKSTLNICLEVKQDIWSTYYIWFVCNKCFTDIISYSSYDMWSPSSWSQYNARTANFYRSIWNRLHI